MSIFVDIIIIVILVLGLVKGWQDGFMRSMVDTVGTVVIFIVSFLIKTPLSKLLYMNLPFFHFKGTFAGISSFNVLLYEGIAYISCVVLLSIIFQVVIAATGISGRLKNISYAHKMPSRIGGMFFSFIEIYVYAFLLVYLGAILPFCTSLVQNSTLGPIIINRTPVLSSGSKHLYKAITDVYNICDGAEDNDKADYLSLDVLLKNKIIDPENAKILVENKKITCKDADTLVKTYLQDKEKK